MAKIEEILSTEYMKKYQENRYPWNWLWIELMGSSEELGRQLVDDMPKFEKFKEEIWEAMSSRKEARDVASKKWGLLIQARINRLDVSLTVWNAFGKIVATATGLLAIMWAATGLALAAQFLTFVGLIVSGGVFTLFPFNIERKKNWYRYVGSHLEAIVKEGEKAKPALS